MLYMSSTRWSRSRSPRMSRAAIYEGESADLSLLMKASAFSSELRKTQQAFETLRRDMQRARIDALFKAGRARRGLNKRTASGVLWMRTGREVYHKLVHESGWTPDQFQDWLEQTLIETLTDSVWQHEARRGATTRR